MRNAFASEISSLARENDKLVLLSADIGNKLFDKFKEAAPDRFFNCGVAEANMIGTAAGLSMSGLIPVCYTIAPFITYRCLEQIRVDLCYHNLRSVIVGVGAGLSYASLGPTHHSLEDIAMLRVLPGIKVICPGDAFEVKAALRAAMQESGPVYIRLGKKGEPLVHKQEPQFEIGRAIEIRSGKDVCILSTGNVLPLAMACAEELDKAMISCSVISFHTVKPLDHDTLRNVFREFSLVVTLEEHSIHGGVGSSVAEWLAFGHVSRAKFLAIGTDDRFLHEAGGQNHARRIFGLSCENIVPKIAAKLSLTRAMV
ncbi:MAG: transketolase family protein [Candidatus Obscuribacterales bacterium]|nr:transketolase family protein [Candidatus Obscuribacterales bacterium]